MSSKLQGSASVNLAELKTSNPASPLLPLPWLPPPPLIPAPTRLVALCIIAGGTSSSQVLGPPLPPLLELLLFL